MFLLQHDFAGGRVICTIRLIDSKLFLLLLGQSGVDCVPFQSETIAPKQCEDQTECKRLKTRITDTTHKFHKRRAPLSLVPRQFPDTLKLNQESSLEVEQFVETREQ